MRLYAILLLILFSSSSYGQSFNIPDSLKNKTFEELLQLALENSENFDIVNLYSKTYLSKAKQEKDTAKIIHGFHPFTYIYRDTDIALAYTDSIIQMAIAFGDDRLIGSGYQKRGNYYADKLVTDKALDNYLVAKKYAKGYPRFNMVLDHNIGIIKRRMGNHAEALEVFKRSWKYFNRKNVKETNTLDYFEIVFALASSYTIVKKHDSASLYNRLGVKESSLANNQSEFYRFVLNEGVNQYKKENYNIAHDSIAKVLKNANGVLSKPNIMVGLYYFGEILLQRNQKDSAMYYFRSFDSLAIETQTIIPDSREPYEYLINYYKDKKDLKNQLKYIERLLKYDSIQSADYKYLSKKLTKEYDTPLLLKEKEQLIASLEADKNTASNQNIIISILLVLSLGGLGYYFYAQRRYKKRFLQLVATNTQQQNVKEDAPKDKSIVSGISEETITSLLQQLQKFEEKRGYLKTKINSKDLAKSFGSNSTYLSQVVNTYKGKNLSTYINDLRIDYAVHKLQSDPTFRKYTIKAIAQEVGFNTSEAFAKTFYKKTGIYPSYFIKNLEKQV